MHDTFLKYIEEKRVSGALLKRLQGLSQEEVACTCRLIEALNPSANSLSRLIELIDETTKRDQIRWQGIFENAEVKEILGHERLGRGEKRQRIRRLLEGLRFPEYAKTLLRLESCARELSHKRGFSIELPIDLEGDAVKICAQVSNCEELRKLGENLLEISADTKARELFSLLKGE